jgi:8-amino-7-oxononanoate synthase
MKPEEWIEKALDGVRRAGLLRELNLEPAGGAARAPDEPLNLASNDYLGLARHPDITAAAVRAIGRYGAGAGAARLLTGTLPCHGELEAALATLKAKESALVFGSGYAANAGWISALVEKDDVVIADRLCHASLLDGIRLSGARLIRFHHNDADHLVRRLAEASGARRKLVLTESVFSMDGDLAPLTEITEASARAGAMLAVDEAHATGVFGPAGAGRVRELGLSDGVTLCMGTLSKALGGYGGFVACPARMRDWMIQRARSFLFSTALPPACAGAALGALEVLAREPDLGARVRARADRFRECLQSGGLDTMQSASPIIPVRIGDAETAVRIAARLRALGIVVGAIRPPTVPPGTSRLRLSISLAQDEARLEAAAAVLIAVVRKETGP